MIEDPYKVCPECGGEFRYDIEVCADCEVPLVFPEEIAPQKARALLVDDEAPPRFPDPPRHEIPASDDLVCLCCGPFAILSGLSAALDDAGIGHRIERGPYERSSLSACLYLHPNDCEAAERISDPPQEVGTDQDCPACGARFPRGEPACRECGLEIFDPEQRCPHCGALVIYGTKEGCPNCGSRLSAR
jgi:predicted amidophosphoribosyltransferase